MTRTAGSGLLLGLLLSTTPLSGQRSERRVFDATAIAAAGWHRLGDIASALAPGTAASVDGFNHALTSSRVGFSEPGAGLQWQVRLDGQIMPVTFGGLWILDAIPVAITQLDSVIIAEGPRLVDGTPVFLGTIDLYTRRVKRALSAVADYQHGDESGDPGPYRYTARSTPNVEKLGPFASGAIAASRGDVALDLGARYSSLNITDERIARRFPSVFGGLQSDVNSSGGSGVLTARIGGGDHFAIGGRGRFTGLMHLPADGSDRSARVITSHAGVSGSMLARRIGVSYAVSATLLEVDSLGSAIPFGLSQDRTMVDGFVRVAPVGAPMSVGAGSSYGRQETADATETRRTDRVWASLSGTRGELTVAADRSTGGDARLSGTFRHRRVLENMEAVGVTLSLLGSPGLGGQSWMDAADAGPASAAAIGAADLRLEFTTRSFMGFAPTWYGRGFSFAGHGSNRVNGVAAGFVAATEPGRRAVLRARAEVSELIGEASETETTTPGGFVEASAMSNLPGRFLVAVSGRYAPSTRWPELEPGARTELPATHRVDLSVNKPLWSERVRAQLIIRNALNSAEVLHPLGAQWNLRTHLAVTVGLPSR